ncbi:MAG: hypothetical protein GYA18_04200 [Chloroflexi bacterium]|nr:hypothetical protein [Chloroflexota bacterium]
MEIKNRTRLIMIVLIRVFLTLGIVMVLFLGMWVGYFTIPLIIIVVFSIILAISDIGILFTLREKNGKETKKTKRRGNGYEFIDEINIDEEHEK